MNKVDEEKTKNLAAGGKFRLDEIPLRKFFEQAQYIEKTLLPAIEKKSGKKSADYQFFTEVYKSMLYAVVIMDREQTVVKQWQQNVQLAQIHKDRADMAERELLKYTTMEDLIMTGAMDSIARGVVQRVNDLLTNK